MQPGYPTHTNDITGRCICLGDEVIYDFPDSTDRFIVVFENNSFRKHYPNWDKTLEKPLLEYGEQAKRMRLKVVRFAKIDMPDEFHHKQQIQQSFPVKSIFDYSIYTGGNKSTFITPFLFSIPNNSNKYGIIEIPDQYMALGFLNRKTHPLPEHECAIKIINVDVDGPSILLCSWNPRENNDLFLGTAKVIYGKYTGIGFHVHKSTDHEFIWYQIVDLALNS